MRSLALSSLVLVTGCTFAASLPPGAGAGSFLDEAKGAVPLSASSGELARALDASARAHLDANIDVLMALRDESIALREDVRAAEHEIHGHVEAKGTVDAHDLERIRDDARRYLELDALLYALWTRYREALPYASEPDPYAPMRAATLLSMHTREAGGLLALAAELVRLDNAGVVVEVLGRHVALTRFLNRGDAKLALPAEGYDRLVGALYDPDHRNQLERQLRAASEQRQRLIADAADDARVGFVLGVVDDSAVAKQIVDESSAGRSAVFLWNVVARSSIDLAGPAIDAFLSSGYLTDDAGAAAK
jgi:hypothetical protein